MNDNADNSIVADSSGMGNTGTFSDATGTSTTAYHHTAGRVGGALSFDGVDDYVNAGSISGGDSAAFTYTAWIKRAIDDTSEQYIITHSANRTLYIENKNVRAGTEAIGDYVGSTTLQPNVWYHVAFTYDGTNGVIYLNSNVDASGTTTVSSGSGSAYIGQCPHDTHRFNGTIDEVKIYNRALSAEEILNDYNASKRHYITAVSDTGLVGYWNFDDNDLNGTTLYDKSGYGNHGTNNGATTSIGGVLKQAFEFNGSNDYVDLGIGTLGYKKLSVAVWFKYVDDGLCTASGGDPYEGLVSKDYCNDFVLSVQCSGSNINKVLTKVVNTSGGSSGNLVSTTLVNDSNWHHAVVTADGTNVNIYIDGKYENQGALSGDVDDDNVRTTIGSYSTLVNYFNGTIDEVKIYNRALSAEEILNNYNASKRKYITAVSDTGLVGYWNFDDNDLNGTTLYDKSGYGNHGTNNGATTSVDGVLKQAFEFNGSSDYVQINHSSSIDVGSGSFTYGLWVYALSSVGTWDMPIFKGGSSANDPGYDMELGSADWSANISDGSVMVQSYFSWTPLNNQWVYLVVVIDRTAQRLYTYVNGVLFYSDADISTVGSINSSAYNLRLGIGIYEICPFNGLIDEVRIYNRALSAEEILNDYNASKRHYIE